MRTSRLSAAVAASFLLCASQWTTVSAGFYVCPAPCEAMLLPRDMETLEDCLCHGKVGSLVDNKAGGSLFRCPEGSAAQRLHPMSFADCLCLAGYTRDDMHKTCSPDQFQCTGRYRLKKGLTKASSIADCDCQAPYKKDEASGQCVLRKCPRAGNYVKKFASKTVTSLADCACVDPFVKNDQSGECLVEAPYECPDNAQPFAKRRPKSFADCHCDWGFVRTQQDTCERESAAFACPNHSVKRAGLGIGEPPRSFADCECEDSREFRRNEATHSCDRRVKDVDGDGRDEIDEDEEPGFRCPPFARPLAHIPHSVEQCECLPGYGWKTPDMTCVPLSAYACPKHSFKADEDLQAERSFEDCECARGYYRDETNGACLEWFLANDNGCPNYAFLRHWPLQSKANCQCIYGLMGEDDSTPEPIPQEDEIDPDEDKKQLRQRKYKRNNTPLVRKKTPQCNAPPNFFNVGFSQCPENSVATSWPLASPDDCICKDGFELLPISETQFTNGDGEGFRCVDPMETITDEEVETKQVECGLPLVKNPFTSDCRLPVEQVRPRTLPKGRKGQTQGEVLFKGIEYDYVLTEDDIMVIQGDVAIGELVRWPGPSDGGDEITTHVLHGYYNAERDHRWKDATMCYEVDSSATQFTATVESAMAHIADVTYFQFRKCRNNACAQDDTCSHDFVSVKATTSSCFSYIGRIGGRQMLGISAECGLGNVIHVLLHAVGLRHTIDRTDRDDHVRIAWECVPETRRSFFVVEEVNATQSTMDTPYDFFSIMHHPPDAFVRGPGERRNSKPQWCQSVFPLIADPNERVAVMAKMGQRELLAVTDIHAVWQLYPSLQLSGKAPTYSSEEQKEGQRPEVFESRLHTQEDVVNTEPIATTRSPGRSWVRKLGSFVGAMVTLVGFGAFVAFGIVEFRRRAMLPGNGAYYSESLLTDKTLYD